MTSILSVKPNVERKQFKCNYLKIGKYFLKFFPYFPNLHKSWNTLKKKMILRFFFVSEIIDYKTWSSLNAQKALCQNTYGQSTC